MIGMNLKPKSIPRDIAGAYLQSIRHQIAAQIGNWAILREKDGRYTSVYLIHILGVNRGEYCYWDDSGGTVHHLTKTINPVAIMNNDAQIVFLDTI